jgi:hypothetical protein
LAGYDIDGNSVEQSVINGSEVRVKVVTSMIINAIYRSLRWQLIYGSIPTLFGGKICVPEIVEGVLAIC